jgi:hypothetical protein
MRCEHVSDHEWVFDVERFEVDDCPEHVKQNEGRRQECGYQEEMRTVTSQSDGPRTNRIGQNVDQSKRPAYDSVSKSAHYKRFKSESINTRSFQPSIATESNRQDTYRKTVQDEVK